MQRHKGRERMSGRATAPRLEYLRSAHLAQAEFLLSDVDATAVCR